VPVSHYRRRSLYFSLKSRGKRKKGDGINGRAGERERDEGILF